MNNIDQETTFQINAASMFVGGHIYDIFMKSGIAPNCTPDQWKKFEKDMVKYIYTVLGENEPQEEVCNFSAMTNAFATALVVADALENRVEALESNDSKNA